MGTLEWERARLSLQEARPGSGLSPGDIRTGFCELRSCLSGKSAVYVKSKLFEFLLLNGRISIDPEDWFADKLDHQGLMAEYNASTMSGVPLERIPDINDGLNWANATGYYETGPDTGHVSLRAGVHVQKRAFGTPG